MMEDWKELFVPLISIPSLALHLDIKKTCKTNILAPVITSTDAQNAPLFYHWQKLLKRQYQLPPNDCVANPNGRI
jgi:hypothetical protein